MIDPTIYDAIPEGWKVLKGATRHPDGCVWITDGRSMFDPNHRIALWRNSELTPQPQNCSTERQGSR